MHLGMVEQNCSQTSFLSLVYFISAQGSVKLEACFVSQTSFGYVFLSVFGLCRLHCESLDENTVGHRADLYLHGHMLNCELLFSVYF